MRVAVMQPYFFPYLGYFQLMAAVDLWIVLDNVNFRKGGYVHRNRIWVGRQPGWFGLPVVGMSPNKLILEHEVNITRLAHSRLLRQIAHGYGCAPYRDDGVALIQAALPLGKVGLVDVLMTGLDACFDAIGVSVPWVLASKVLEKTHLKSSARIVALCQKAGASEYVNLPGGRALYDAREFSASGIRLGFIEPALLPYPQSQGSFCSNLSILDLIMNVAPCDRSKYVKAGSIDWMSP